MQSFFIKIFKFCYKHILKPIMFRIDAELVHDFFINTGDFLGKSSLLKKLFTLCFFYTSPIIQTKQLGTNFASPIGLSAGFDYEGKLGATLPTLGFGFQSVGTVSYLSSEGNEKPRLGRLPKSLSILVNKGFRNTGIKNIVENNVVFPKNFPIGLSIGATNCPENKDADSQIEDILKSFEYIKNDHRFAYFELNISCPNVVGAEYLTQPEKLKKLLSEIEKLQISKPLLVKFPIETPWEEAKILIEILIEYGVAGVIIGNLAKKRDNSAFVQEEIQKAGKGNFSGKPTQEFSNNLIQKTCKTFGDKILIIGLGGVMSPEDAYKKFRLGASLVQMVSGLIFEGPQIVYEINTGLEKLLKKDGFRSIHDIIGIDA